MYRSLIVLAACLALVVIVAGAYVRLSDAGLGCPDWPGCYGRLTPSHAAPSIAEAVAQQGGEHGPVSYSKAWKEMGHRYLAGVLGLLIGAIALIAWRRRQAFGQRPWLAIALVALVAFQAALGMWTVTLLLKPAIVTAHLLGGMAVFALLLWLALCQWRFARADESRAARSVAVLGLAAVAVQIALGGWVSANYAGLACPDLPLCLGEAVPPMEFAHAFHVLRDLGSSPDGSLLPREALTAIHWLHRVFAIVVAALVAAAAWQSARTAALRPVAVVIVVLLAAQVTLGISNVAAGLPLALAVAHNMAAALLLGALVVLNFFAFRELGARPQTS